MPSDLSQGGGPVSRALTAKAKGPSAAPTAAPADCPTGHLVGQRRAGPGARRWLRSTAALSAELGQAVLLHPPGPIGSRSGRLEPPPGGQTLEWNGQDQTQHHQAGALAHQEAAGASPWNEAAASAACRWRSPLEREPSTTRPQARGRLEPMATGASLIRFLSLRLKPKAAPAPRTGRGPGAVAGALEKRVAVA